MSVGAFSGIVDGHVAQQGCRTGQRSRLPAAGDSDRRRVSAGHRGRAHRHSGAASARRLSGHRHPGASARSSAMSSTACTSAWTRAGCTSRFQQHRTSREASCMVNGPAGATGVDQHRHVRAWASCCVAVHAVRGAQPDALAAPAVRSWPSATTASRRKAMGINVTEVQA